MGLFKSKRDIPDEEIYRPGDRYFDPELVKSSDLMRRWSDLYNAHEASTHVVEEGYAAEIAVAVSYTHLDVYKRQPHDALRMYRLLMENADVDCVAACQVDRKEGFVLKLFKRAFYRCLLYTSRGCAGPSRRCRAGR